MREEEQVIEKTTQLWNKIRWLNSGNSTKYILNNSMTNKKMSYDM